MWSTVGTRGSVVRRQVLVGGGGTEVTTSAATQTKSSRAERTRVTSEGSVGTDATVRAEGRKVGIFQVFQTTCGGHGDKGGDHKLSAQIKTLTLRN